MKFLIVGDLHGKKPKIHFKDFDAIIAVGDFCSDTLRGDMFQASREGIEWYDHIDKKKLVHGIKRSLKRGRKILEYLNSFSVPIFVIPGNREWSYRSPRKFLPIGLKNYYNLLKDLDDIVDVHYKIRNLSSWQIIGYGNNWGPELPIYEEDKERFKDKIWKLKKDYTKRLARLEKLFRKAKKKKKSIIFLSHNVPFNTPLDKITNKKSPRYGKHYGSLVARKIIEKYQPAVAIGGHMHEHFGKCKIGKTICINAGFGQHVNILMELNKRVKLKFWDGKGAYN